ncbi:hypothetical protein AVEN_34267-1 [Araneus ventricosus]|uniref:Uncharacterized protein n=1 Tax=Araneus ventricosus TaxID=182803 RepID=A0A4Y2L7R8_ARAVE|nr:hypothetical protein AVEN_34267-1 [Araneus ventricosus]
MDLESSIQANDITACRVKKNLTGNADFHGHTYFMELHQIKDFINEFHPVCRAFQGTYLKPGDQAKMKHYCFVRRDSNSGRVSGGIALLVSHNDPSSIIPLHTNLQAVQSI